MPTWEQHIQQALHNEAFVASLDIDSTPYVDWAVTGIFYAALHYVSAYLCYRRYTDYDTHWDLWECVSMDPKLGDRRDFRNSYRHLRDDSEDARYRMKKLPPADVHQLRDQQFNTVRQTVLALLPHQQQPS